MSRKLIVVIQDEKGRHEFSASSTAFTNFYDEFKLIPEVDDFIELVERPDEQFRVVIRDFFPLKGIVVCLIDFPFKKI